MPRNKKVKDLDNTKDTYLGTIAGMPCHVVKLRGDGITDKNSNWRLWNADMKVFREGSKTLNSPNEDETWASIDDEITTRMDRTRKAQVWFSISEPLREKHLLDMGGRDKTTEDLMRRVWERVAPEGTPYHSLGKIVVTEAMRESVRRRDERRKKAREEGREEEDEEGEGEGEERGVVGFFDGGKRREEGTNGNDVDTEK